jgi:hypothetical protein
VAVPELAGREQLTRRQLLKSAGVAAGIAATGSVGIELLRKEKPARRIASYPVRPSGPVREFHSRPDLRPPTVTVADADQFLLRVRGRPEGYLFLGPGPVSLSGSQQYGPLIVDRRGEPVWFRPLAPGLTVSNFAPSTYRGEPVLAWWEGKLYTSGYGQGEVVIVDRSYRELTRVRAAGGRSMDFHGLCITPQGTALFTCYPQIVTVDLRPLGGPKRFPAYESAIQEVDIATGRLLFEWQSLQHVPVADSHEPLGRENYDYLHINSIALTPDGQLLVSGRHTWTLYKLDRRTGEVIWRLGGKRSQFELGRGAGFAWQHDARQISDGVMTMFDNGTNGPIETERQSRGLVLDVDETRRTATLRKAYTGPKPLLASSMGSLQMLDSGRVVVGWGTASHTSEFGADGALLFDAALPESIYSFRGSWLDWRSEANRRPALAAGRDPHSDVQVVYASWNGETGIAGWRLTAGGTADALRTVGVAGHRGFETAIPLHEQARFASVTALDHAGHALGTSQTIKI